MNLFELVFVLIALVISYWLGIYFVGRIGWWGVVPGVACGFAATGGGLWLALRIWGRRDIE